MQVPDYQAVVTSSFRGACFTGAIRLGRREGLCSLVAMYASRFRNCVCAERNPIGGARKNRRSHKTRVTLRREVHAAQEVLEARVGVQVIELWVNSKKGHPCTPFGKGPFKPCQRLVLFTKSSIN